MKQLERYLMNYFLEGASKNQRARNLIALRYNFATFTPQLLETAPTATGIYSHHLQRHWTTLQKQPELAIGRLVRNAGVKRHNQAD